MVEFGGSTKNNIVTTKYSRIFEDPSAPPAERFKAIGARSGFYARERDADGNYVEVPLDEDAVARLRDPHDPAELKQLHLQEWHRESFQGEWGTLKAFMIGAVSPDGLHWTELEEPLLEEFVDGDKVVFYDEVLGLQLRGLRRPPGRRARRRRHLEGQRQRGPALGLAGDSHRDVQGDVVRIQPVEDDRAVQGGQHVLSKQRFTPSSTPVYVVDPAGHAPASPPKGSGCVLAPVELRLLPRFDPGFVGQRLRSATSSTRCGATSFSCRTPAMAPRLLARCAAAWRGMQVS